MCSKVDFLEEIQKEKIRIKAEDRNLAVLEAVVLVAVHDVHERQEGIVIHEDIVRLNKDKVIIGLFIVRIDAVPQKDKKVRQVVAKTVPDVVQKVSEV